MALALRLLKENLFSVILAIIAGIFVIAVFMVYWRLLCRRNNPLADYRRDDELSADFPSKRYAMRQVDILPMLIVTAVYAFTAFWALGDRVAPQSFCHFGDRGEYVVIELERETDISSVMYYSGLKSGDYFLQFSLDGENWVDQPGMPQSHADLFKWQYADLIPDEPHYAKHIRIIAGSELYLGELALFDENGNLIPASSLSYNAGCAPLFDEQELVPDEPTYMNSAYFDEIYHARTAYENVTNIYPYEISHPPLGKLIISIGIRAFGMTPFGWRFMGTLFGVLMLPILYIFLKNLFGSTIISTCGTVLFAFDFMHLVQTRIATIDTYAVFFILLSYFFMYRYLTSDRDGPFSNSRRGLWSLALCGLSFGIGCACKWTVIYAGGGLAVIWLLSWIFRGRALVKSGQASRLRRSLALNIFWCFAFFVVIPLVIYYLSYYPYGKAKGLEGASMYLTRDYLDIVLDNQKFMFRYHSGLVSEHPYSSRWYQWIFDIRPILYYSRYYDNNYKACFGAFMNPLLCWGGLLAMISMAFLGLFKGDKKALFILIGYLSQLLPWVPIARLTFAYHYFPSVVFLVLAMSHVLDTMRRRMEKWKPIVYGYTGACAGLFALFYPVLTGLTIQTAYIKTFLKWIPGMWPW